MISLPNLTDVRSDTGATSAEPKGQEGKAEQERKAAAHQKVSTTLAFFTPLV